MSDEISDGVGGGRAHFCKQELPAGFSHEFINPDVSAKILARLVYLGGTEVWE